ncbi:DUF4166 domain-containing protein [Sphingomonas sp. ZT3P38]|uniref:DUF4166 domain-containing protein n=1 Tax=Parasphingomonas zepuensis TaxID=3096161 RepID=UPI002FC87983
MSRILILGGYGGFGARLARRLAGRRYHILVAGRNAEKARAFCAGLPGTEPVVADREGDVAALLAAQRPDLLIDAAGPFQHSDYRVPLACIEAGVPYLDLADGRAFVTGIGALDAAAREAGVAVVAGASSVPALSGAVARHLAAGTARVTQVEVAISASNRATAGPSVAAAILSYVGRPVRLWRNRRWTRGWGWQELRRESFAVTGVPEIRGRWVALAEVPDLDLLPAMLPGRPAVTFRAGTEISLQTLGLWLLSWPIRWFGLSAVPLAPLLLPLQRLTSILTSDRSAMSVHLTGEDSEGFVERRWTLIAQHGDGPEIPTLAAALLAEEILAGRLPAGARDAGSLLDLAQFESIFAQLAIRHATVERRLPPPLYRRVMGPAFDALPEAARALHSVCRDGGAQGQGRVERGTGLLARAIGAIMRFPPTGSYKLHVAFAEQHGVETWTRRFGPHAFTSRLRQRGVRLVERFGPLRFHFDLPSNTDGLEMVLRRWTCLGIPLPLALAPRIQAREWQDGDRFRFDVAIALPLIGLVVHYDGWLLPDA